MFIIFGIFILLFIASNLLNLKIKKVIEDIQFNFWEEAKLFYKMGQAIEKTPLWNASNKLDYLLYAFAVNDFSESPIVDGVSCPEIGDNSVQSP